MKISVLNDYATITLPYKNGHVIWKVVVVDNSDLAFSLDYCPTHYNPYRVGLSHGQRLLGKKLIRKLVRSANAHHQWDLAENLKKVVKELGV